jgi:hypothetical protein
MDSTSQEAYLYEQEGTTFTVTVAGADLAHIQCQLKEEASHNNRESPTNNFKPVDDTKVIRIDPKNLDKVICIGARLSSKLEASLMEFLCKIVDVYVWKPSDMPGIPRDVTKHCLSIKLKVKHVQRHLSHFNEERQKAIGDELIRLLVAGFIKEVKHLEWLANPVLVKKKNRKWRMCVNYTSLNKVC